MKLRDRRVVLTALAALLVAAVAAVAPTVAADGSDAEGTLVVLESDLAGGLDFDGASTAQVATAEMISQFYGEPVEYPTKLQGGILVPNYKVPQTGYAPALFKPTKVGPRTWRVTVRSNVKSCAGNTLTADDLMWTFARAKSATGVSNFAWFAGYLADIWGLAPLLPKATAKDKALTDAEVRKIDATTVEVRQHSPNELFPRLWTTFEGDIFDSVEAKKHATAADPWAHTWTQTQGAAGYGPYCLESWQKGSQFVLTANPNYWRGQPEFKRVVIRKVPSNAARVASIQSGAADIATDLTPQEFNTLRSSSKVDVLSFYNNRTTSLIFGFKYAPWNLPKSIYLRQAFAYAMPYGQIIKQNYYGQAEQWRSQVSRVANGYVPSNRYRTDLAKAKALLAKAGFPGGKGLDKYGPGLTLFYPAERSAILEPVANSIRTSLGKIGVPISLSPIPIVEFADRQLSKQDMGLHIYDFGSPYGADMGYAFNLFFLTNKKGGLLNAGYYSNAKADNLFLQSQHTTGSARQAALTKMQAIMMNDLPQVPIVEWKHQVAFRKGISCLFGHPDNTIRFWFLTTGTCKPNTLTAR